MATAPQTEDYRHQVDAVERERASRAQSMAIAAENLDGDLLWLMETKRGRRIVSWLLRLTYEGEEAFHEVHAVQSYRLGRMALGRAIAAQLQRSCPRYYLEMLEERKGSPEAP